MNYLIINAVLTNRRLKSRSVGFVVFSFFVLMEDSVAIVAGFVQSDHGFLNSRLNLCKFCVTAVKTT